MNPDNVTQLKYQGSKCNKPRKIDKNIFLKLLSTTVTYPESHHIDLEDKPS